MFDSKKKSTERLVDAADLVLDFATLGEYGLEPADGLSRPCESRRRPGFPRSTGSWNAAISRFSTQS